MTDEDDETDWEETACELASTLADIVISASNALGSSSQPGALIERGKVLAFLRQARSASFLNSRISLTIRGPAEIVEEIRSIAPGIVNAVITGLIEAIEAGAHLGNIVEIVRMQPGKDIRQ